MYFNPSGIDIKTLTASELPDLLRRPYNILCEMKKQLIKNEDSYYGQAFLDAVIQSFEEFEVRITMNTGQGYYLPVTPERKEGIDRFYSQAALTMYKGFALQMESYSNNKDSRFKKIASCFQEAQK
jgi:vacuolar-type H+-ATPase subunit E/Vma4